MRIDKLLVQKQLATSLDDAHRLISQNRVRVGGLPVTNPSRQISPDSPVSIRKSRKFVSRGGEKLDHALKRWLIPMDGTVWLDIGSSTGGFTDCLLQAGARHVHALDVGRGLLDPKLLNDPRVTSWEGTHVNDLPTLHLNPAPTHICMDVSFIGLEKVLPVVRDSLGCLPTMALYKPQFECGREEEGFRGVVHQAQTVLDHLPGLIHRITGLGWTGVDVCESPIQGREGNHEFWLALGLTDSVISMEKLDDLIRKPFLS